MKTSPEYRALAEKLWFAEEIARLLIRYRMAHGLSQKALGRRLGMEESAISRLESGQHTPSGKTVNRILIAFKKQIVFVDVRDVQIKRQRRPRSKGRRAKAA